MQPPMTSSPARLLIQADSQNCLGDDFVSEEGIRRMSSAKPNVA
jgi:hypothetical protein